MKAGDLARWDNGNFCKIIRRVNEDLYEVQTIPESHIMIGYKNDLKLAEHYDIESLLNYKK